MFPDQIIKIPCAAHRLNLCVNDLFTLKKIIERNEKFYIYDLNDDGELRKIEISEDQKFLIENVNLTKQNILKILKKCKSLVGTFKHSEKLARQLTAKQKELNLTCKKLVQDVSTRWSSTHDLIKSIIYNKNPLNSLSYVPGNQLCLPTDQEYDMLEDLTKILEPLKELTTVLSARNYVVITHLYPSIYNLIFQELNSIPLVTAEVKILSKSLADSLKKRFSFLLKNSMFKAITYLDHDYKKFEFIQNSVERFKQINEAKEFLVSFYEKNKDKYNKSDQNSSPLQSNSSPSTPSSSSSECSQNSQRISSSIISTPVNTKQNKRLSLLTLKDKKNQKVTNVIDINEELDRYSHASIDLNYDLEDYDGLGNPMEFYKLKGSIFPMLKCIAIDLFCIAPTSVSAESLFSIAGLIQDDLRNRLNPKNLDKIIFIKINSKYFVF